MIANRTVTRATITITNQQWPGKRANAPRPWPNGGYPVDVHDSTIPDETTERFWSKVDQSGGPDACWPWMCTRDWCGYGRFRTPGQRERKGHRVAYALVNGPIPAGMLVCHICDNPPCCNPAHLWLGTHADNHADRGAKGRTARGDRHGKRLNPETCARGEGNGRSKLTADQVRDIRRRYQDGETRRALARRFGVGKTAIAKIVRLETWRHVGVGA